jgi:hypothetical protein
VGQAARPGYAFSRPNHVLAGDVDGGVRPATHAGGPPDAEEHATSRRGVGGAPAARRSPAQTACQKHVRGVGGTSVGGTRADTGARVTGAPARGSSTGRSRQ